MNQRKDRATYLQMTEIIDLNRFGAYVQEAWGHFPYLVGSTLVRADYRDVDVRLILPDDEYERLLGPLAHPHYMNDRWNAHVIAWTHFGQVITHLPIDFQIDQQTEANELYDGRRHTIGMVKR